MSDFQKSNTLIIQSQNCSRTLSPMAQCSICQQVCPTQSLLYTETGWQAVDCIQCGLCVALCPKQVFHLDDLTLLAQAPTQAQLQLTCYHNQQAPAEAWRLNCLQQLSPLLLLQLLSMVPSLTLHICEADCAACAAGWYPAGLALQLQQYHLPLENLHFIHTTPTATPADRRSFFKSLANSTQKTSKSLLLDSLNRFLAPFEDTTQPKQSNSVLWLRRQALWQLYQQQMPANAATEELPFRQLQCDGCTFCGACSRLCPTQALQHKDTEQEAILSFHPTRCLQCNLCLELCLHKKLYWQNPLTIQQFIQDHQVIAHSEKKVCSNCGHPYAAYPADPESDLCSFCRH